MITSELLVVTRCEECRRRLPVGRTAYVDPSDPRVEGNVYCEVDCLERARDRNSPAPPLCECADPDCPECHGHCERSATPPAR